MRRVAKAAAALAAALAALAPGEAGADSWGPFPDQRVVSSDGRHYAIVREAKEKGVVEFEIHERGGGRPPLEPARESSSSNPRVKSAAAAVAEPGDPLVGSGVLPHAPLEVLVPNGGKSLVLFENYGRIGSGNCVTVVDREGRIRASARLADLFDSGTIAGFPRSVSSIWWYEGVFLAEEKGVVVLVAAGDLLRAVRLDGGVDAAPRPGILIDGILSRGDATRRLALDVASRLRPEGLASAAARVLSDPSAPLATRARAAVALKAVGDDSGAGTIVEASRKGAPKEAREYALARLAEFVPRDEALLRFRDAMRGKADDGWSAAQEGFVSIGAAAVPVLRQMLGESGESPDYRGGAAHALRRIGSEEAIDDLLAAVADGSEYVANAACNAAIATGGPKLLPGLVDLLARGTTQDARIAHHFKDNPSPAAVPALVAALRRRSDGPPHVKRAIASALEACAPGVRGAGLDADAWERALREK